jgi:hypothetical protein
MRPSAMPPPAMILPDGATLLATVCNTTPNAIPYALWLARGEEQYLVDLSDVLGQPGDGGLTGLACLGDKIYVAVQSTAARILILDRCLAPVGVITSPEFVDIHSLHTAGDALIVCSTGAQSVIRVDIADHSTTKLCQFDTTVHLNSAWLDEAELWFDEPELLVCCHYPSRVVPEAVGGGVINAGRRHVVLVGLGQPHSFSPSGSGFLVLDSDAQRVIRFDHTGVRQQQVLSGFLRGTAACRGSLFVASSTGRVISRKTPTVPTARQFWDMAAERVCIYELDEASLEVKAQHFPMVAGFEIYELLALDSGQAIDLPRERLVVPDVHAMARAYYEATKRALAEVHHRDAAAPPTTGPTAPSGSE